MTRVPPAVVVRRWGYRLGWRVLSVWWLLARPHTRGVKLLIVDGDRALFVRHTYGPSDWELPAGGRARGEDPVAAARREAREELGLDIADWVDAGLLVDRQRATANLSCMVAAWDGQPMTLNLGELRDHRWAPLAAPPAPFGRLGRGTLALPGVPDAVRRVRSTAPERPPS